MSQKKTDTVSEQSDTFMLEFCFAALHRLTTTGGRYSTISREGDELAHDIGTEVNLRTAGEVTPS
jgi:hypothetical protein